MQLRFLHVSGPHTEPANVDFVPGLNVINGPSNTGKSHILRLIDYVLGAQSPREPIAEQALYDLVHLGVAMDDGSEKTLVRALQGGEFRIIEGLVKARPQPNQGLAAPGHHRPAYTCDGNVEEIVAAAKAETADVQRRADELKLTMDGLTEERAERVTRAREILPELQTVQANISREVPSVQTVRSDTNRVIARKLVVQKSLDLVRRRDKLLTQRTELGVVPGYDSTTIVAQQSLNGTDLDSFCQVVEAELRA